jgi:hypothetical protein
VYIDWDAQFESSISKVTAAEVHQAFEKYIDPSHLVIATSGATPGLISRARSMAFACVDATALALSEPALRTAKSPCGLCSTYKFFLFIDGVL